MNIKNNLANQLKRGEVLWAKISSISEEYPEPLLLPLFYRKYSHLCIVCVQISESAVCFIHFNSSNFIQGIVTWVFPSQNIRIQSIVTNVLILAFILFFWFRETIGRGRAFWLQWQVIFAICDRFPFCLQMLFFLLFFWRGSARWMGNHICNEDKRVSVDTRSKLILKDAHTTPIAPRRGLVNEIVVCSQKNSLSAVSEKLLENTCDGIFSLQWMTLT